jgi:hypothetical protein
MDLLQEKATAGTSAARAFSTHARKRGAFSSRNSNPSSSDSKPMRTRAPKEGQAMNVS